MTHVDVATVITRKDAVLQLWYVHDQDGPRHWEARVDKVAMSALVRSGTYSALVMCCFILSRTICGHVLLIVVQSPAPEAVGVSRPEMFENTFESLHRLGNTKG